MTPSTATYNRFGRVTIPSTGTDQAVTCYWEVPTGKPIGPDGKPVVRWEARYAVRFESAEQFKAFVWSLAT